MPAEPGLRYGVIGCGRIGLRIATRLADDPGAPRLAALLCRPAQAGALAARFGAAAICTDLPGFIARAPQVAVEAASAALLAEAGPALLAAGIDVMPLSLAAFADPAVEARLRAAAAAGPGCLEIPAGAMASLDALAAAREDGLDSVSLRVSYPPARLAGTPAGPLDDLTAPRTVFAGSVREAAARYPRHLNVSVGVALAGLGLDATRFELVADPGITQCRFDLAAQAGPGALRLSVGGRDLPVEEDPVDYTTFSVMRLLRRRLARVKV
jgi:aspartate dehydrogenase